LDAIPLIFRGAQGKIYSQKTQTLSISFFLKNLPRCLIFCVNIPRYVSYNYTRGILKIPITFKDKNKNVNTRQKIASKCKQLAFPLRQY